ncbi:MAG: AEC family transporter [Rhodospirillaceae bacterium]
MTQIFAALIPMFLVIAVGALLRARRVVGAEGWDAVERLTFYVLFPCLLVSRIGSAEMPGAGWLPLAGAVMSVTAAIWIAVTVLRPGIRWAGPFYAAVVHGMLRPNSYIAFAGAFALYGEAGLTLAAVCIFAATPLANLLTVYSHCRWGGTAADGQADAHRRALSEAVRNPVVIACVLGATLNLSGWGLPPLISDGMDLLGRASLALGLLAVGASLDLRALRTAGGAAGTAVAVKLAVMPALAVFACGVFGVGGVAVSVAVMYAAAPVSATAYVIARRMGDDGELMAAIVALSTLISAATLPVVIWALGAR